MAASQNVVAINDDLTRRLEQAPLDLLALFHKDGFRGALKFVKQFKELIDLLVCYHIAFVSLERQLT
jgi:hypothetical protein